MPSSIKDFIPPILIRFIKAFLDLGGNKEYPTYFLAEKVCTQDAYQNIELCNMIADKTVIYAESLSGKPYNLNPTNVFLLSAINQYLNINSKKNLNLLDFGGACGAHYFEIRRFLPKDLNLNWFVLETEQMTKSAKTMDIVNEELIFVSTFDEIGIKIDFIYSSCALHYVSNPYRYTKDLLNIKADWLLFNRMMFNEEDRDFITVQKSFLSSNGPGALPNGYSERILSYPHTTLSFNKFNSMILDDDYELEWIFAEISGSYQIKNMNTVGKGLLYKIKGNKLNELS